MSIDVIATPVDWTAFVASRRPPSPTSRMATSTPAARKISSAAAVVASKNVGGAGSAMAASSVSPMTRSSSSAADRRAVDGEPLFEIDQMRGGVAAGPVPGRSQRPFEHRRDGPLSVRPGDGEGAIRLFGMSQSTEEGADLFQPELDAEQFEREQLFAWR